MGLRRSSTTSRARLGEDYFGFNLADRSDRAVIGRFANLAPQPKLGLRAKRRLGTCAGDCGGAFAFGAHPSWLLSRHEPGIVALLVAGSRKSQPRVAALRCRTHST